MKKGQALIFLLVIVAIGIITTSAIFTLSIVSSQSALSFTNGEVALQLAKSGVENAIIRLIRDPSYTGEVMNMTGGTVTISVVGNTAKTIRSKSIVGKSVRILEAKGDYNNTVFILAQLGEIK